MFESKTCTFCKKQNEELQFPQDYYVFVYIRDLSRDLLQPSDYRLYSVPSFDCEYCHKRNKITLEKSKIDQLIIIHENDQVMNYSVSN